MSKMLRLFEVVRPIPAHAAIRLNDSRHGSCLKEVIVFPAARACFPSQTRANERVQEARFFPVPEECVVRVRGHAIRHACHLSARAEPFP